MNLQALTLLTALSAGVGMAQVTTLPAPLPFPVQRHDALKQFLVLSDAQVDALIDVQKSRQDAERAIYDQINERQRQLRELLSNGSNDAANIGRLMVEINNLRRQLPLAGNFRETALAVLNPAQRTKLAELTRALELQRTAGDAVALNLIDYPRIPDARILPVGGAEPSVTVVSEP